MASVMERKLAELLVRESIISQSDLDIALSQQTEKGGSLGRILIDNKLASEWEIAAALGKQLNVPFITLSHYEIDPAILQSIPEDLVRKYQIVPVDKTGETLTVALADPANIYLQDELRLLTNCKIVPVISFESDIQEAISRYYHGDGNELDEMLKELSDDESEILRLMESGGDGEIVEDVNDLSVQADDAPGPRL